MWREADQSQVTVAGHLGSCDLDPQRLRRANPEGMRRELSGCYTGNLRTHRFCGALPGDGWSGNFEAAVAMGCIPVRAAATGRASMGGTMPWSVRDVLRGGFDPIMIIEKNHYIFVEGTSIAPRISPIV